MLILIEENANCPDGGSWRFHTIGSPQRVTQVRLYDDGAVGQWFEVVGWTGHASQPVCEAQVHKIDDSGSGTAFLISGGAWGVRLRPVSELEPWSVQCDRQRGVPYVVVDSIKDLLLEEKS